MDLIWKVYLSSLIQGVLNVGCQGHMFNVNQYLPKSRLDLGFQENKTKIFRKRIFIFFSFVLKLLQVFIFPK